MNNTGYLHSLYSQSLIEFGEPPELSTSKGWILKRPIPGTSQFGGMGRYSIFAWNRSPNLYVDKSDRTEKFVV
jgi:hypothetical protein